VSTVDDCRASAYCWRAIFQREKLEFYNIKPCNAEDHPNDGGAAGEENVPLQSLDCALLFWTTLLNGMNKPADAKDSRTIEENREKFFVPENCLKLFCIRFVFLYSVAGTLLLVVVFLLLLFVVVSVVSVVLR